MTDPERQLILCARGLSRAFGGIRAVREVDITCAVGERLAVIGPNGAGKSTLFALLAGALKPNSGTIELDGQIVTGLSPHDVCARGMVRTFQIPGPFLEMSVLENVVSGSFLRHRHQKAAFEHAREIVDRFGFSQKMGHMAASLNVADRKRLEIARAYSTGPKVLLLDEVGAGLSVTEQSELIELVRGINAEGISIVFTEHVLPIVAGLAQRVVVMNEGATLMVGTVDEAMDHPEVVEAYLGVSDA